MFAVNKGRNVYDIHKLFDTLVSLFATNKRTSEKELQGLFAELFVLIYFDQQNINLYEYWQSKDRMKFDFLHEQLLVDLYDIKIISIIMERSDKGITLYDLIDQVRRSQYLTYELLLHIEKLIKKIDKHTLESCAFDQKKLKQGLKIYSADDIPHFDGLQPQGVCDTEYNCDLTSVEELDKNEFVEWLKNNDKDAK